MTLDRKDKKKAKLRNLRLSELSLVDRPASPMARIVLIKRASDDDTHAIQHDRPALHSEDHHIRKEAPMSNFASTVDALEQRGLSPLDAYRKAARDNPGALAKFNTEGIAKAEAAARPPVVKRASVAEQEFELAAAGIAERDKVPLHVAMSRARQKFPDKFRAAYSN